MSDETPDINSAEAAAEEILREELAKVDMNGEDCPQGDACAVHHRNDEEIIHDDIEFGRIITYVGENAIITSDNPELTDPIIQIKAAFGLLSPEDAPQAYETCVINVGEGALADVRALDKDAAVRSIRFVQQHDDWSNFKNAHLTVVEGVRNGLIDVSEPAFPKEK